jgi:hypothetical protein
MSISCDPSSLANAARCFESCGKDKNESIKTYLLCQFAQGPSPAIPGNIDIDAEHSLNGSTIVTWTNSDTPTTNEIWRAQNGGAFSLLSTVAGTTHTFTDLAALPALDVWDYKVRACNGITCSAFTDVRSAANGITKTGAADVTLSYPTLVITYAAVNVDSMPNLTSFSAPLLRFIYGANGFRPALSPVFTSFNLDALVQAVNGPVNFAGTAVGVLSFPKLTTTGDSIYAPGTPVTSCSAPLYVNCGNMVVFDNCASLVSVSLPAVTVIPNGLSLSQCTALTSVTFTALTAINANLQMDNCSALTSLSFPSLQQINTDVVASNCTLLASVSLPVLASVGAFGVQVNFSSCPALTSFSAPNAIWGNSILLSWNFDGLNQASVDEILHRGVLSGTTGSDFELANGTNSTPSAAGLADKAILVATVPPNTVNNN